MAAVALAATGSVEVKSAGFRKEGGRAASRVRLMAQVFGYDLEAHRSSKVSPELLAWADLVIYMDGGNRERLVAAMQACGHLKPFACLGRWASPPRPRIPDPAFIADRQEFVRVICAVEAAARALGASLASPRARAVGMFSVPEGAG
jgi:protein-tyrosine-phosphatase